MSQISALLSSQEFVLLLRQEVVTQREGDRTSKVVARGVRGLPLGHPRREMAEPRPQAVDKDQRR
jgi:hypothetical protein